MKVTKKNATMTRVTDLFVKLSNLYKDAYIIRGSIVIPGNEVSERILGTLMCTLEPDYKEAFAAFGGDVGCLYVPSVVDMKKWLQEKSSEELEPTAEIIEEATYYMTPVIVEEKIAACVSQVEAIEERFNPVHGDKIRWWRCIGENQELIETIFGLKSIFNYPITIPPEELNGKEVQETDTLITISKQLLPLVTEKNIRNAYIGTTGKRSEQDDELMEVLLDFRFSHFRMMIIYNIVVLPWEPDADDYESGQ